MKNRLKKVVPFPQDNRIYLIGPLIIYLLYFLAKILKFKGPINGAGFIIVVCILIVLFGFLGLLITASIGTKINKKKYEERVEEFNKSKTNKIIKQAIKSIIAEAILLFFVIFLAVGISEIFQSELEIFYNKIPYLFLIFYTGLSLWAHSINKNPTLSVALGVIGFLFPWLIAAILIFIVKFLGNIFPVFSNLIRFQDHFGPLILILVAVLGSPLWILIVNSFFQENEEFVN